MLNAYRLTSFMLILLINIKPIHVEAASTQDKSDCKPLSQKAYRQTYQTFSEAPLTPMTKRLNWISKQFFSAPYAIYVLGDGEQDPIDQCPIYRFDAFDCETYVTTVLALAFSDNQAGFEQCLRSIRYQNGNVGFITRNHFTSIDWNTQNQRMGRLKDITKTIVDAQGHPIFQWSKTWIDRAGWFNKLTIKDLRFLNPHDELKQKNLDKLKAKTKSMPKVHAKLPYIPLTALFQENGQPNQAVFDQIPNGAIVEIICPNWALKDKIGTNLDISHLGFVFRYAGQLWFRNASSIHHRVVDEPLIAYLKKTLSSPTIKGINIQVVLPDKPSGKVCS